MAEAGLDGIVMALPGNRPRQPLKQVIHTFFVVLLLRSSRLGIGLRPYWSSKHPSHSHFRYEDGKGIS